MILVSKKIKYTEAELSFEKDVDGLVTFDGERIRPDDVEDGDASAAPEATPAPTRFVAIATRAQRQKRSLSLMMSSALTCRVPMTNKISFRCRPGSSMERVSWH